jgi:DNA-binding protein Fis
MITFQQINEIFDIKLKAKSEPIIDIIIDYCEKNDLDLDEMVEYVEKSQMLKDVIRDDMLSLGFIRKMTLKDKLL